MWEFVLFNFVFVFILIIYLYLWSWLFPFFQCTSLFILHYIKYQVFVNLYFYAIVWVYKYFMIVIVYQLKFELEFACLIACFVSFIAFLCFYICVFESVYLFVCLCGRVTMNYSVLGITQTYICVFLHVFCVCAFEPMKVKNTLLVWDILCCVYVWVFLIYILSV